MTMGAMGALGHPEIPDYSGIHQYLRQSTVLIVQTIDCLLETSVDATVTACTGYLKPDHAVLLCGNRGSAADAMHMTGELVGRYLKDRPALRVMCLSDSPIILTAWSNDVRFDTVSAR